MCAHNRKRICLDKVIAYKIMREIHSNYYAVSSLWAGNSHRLGIEESAEHAWYNNIATCEDYSVGFHAYALEQDAWDIMSRILDIDRLVVVKVELGDVVFEGTDRQDEASPKTYVANKCKFLEIVSMEK